MVSWVSGPSGALMCPSPLLTPATSAQVFPLDCCPLTRTPTPCRAWAGGRNTKQVRQTVLFPQSSLIHGMESTMEWARTPGCCRTQTGSSPREGGQEQLSERDMWWGNRRLCRGITRGMTLESPRNWGGPCVGQWVMSVVQWAGSHRTPGVDQNGKPACHFRQGVSKLQPVGQVQPSACFCTAYELRLSLIFKIFGCVKCENYVRFKFQCL